MEQQFGTQGGFEGLLGATTKFETGTEVFKTAVGKFAFGALALEKTFSSDEFKNFAGTTLKLSGALKGMTEVFAKSKLIDVFSDLSLQLYDSRKQFERSFSLFDDGRGAIVDSLREQTEETHKFGIRMDQNVQSFKALAGLFGTLDFEAELASTASMIEKAFMMSADSSSELVMALSEFGGMTAANTLSYMEELNKEFHIAGLSNETLGKAMEGASQNMWRLNLNTEKGQKRFLKMSVAATKMGVSIDKMIDASDKFRTMPGAIEGSVTAALAGMNMSANELLSISRGGDPTIMFDRVFDHLGKFTDEQGNLTQLGIDQADMLGSMISMDRKEIQMALMRLNKTGQHGLESYKEMNERLYRQQDIQEKMENALYDLGAMILPIMDPLFGMLEWMTKNAGWTKTIMVTLLSMAAIMKTRGLIGRVGGGGGIKEVLQRSTAPVFNMGGFYDDQRNMTNRKGGRYRKGKIGRGTRIKRVLGAFMMGQQTEEEAGRTAGRGGSSSSPRSPRGGGHGAAPNQQKLQNTTKAMTANAKQMAASAIPMLAFAASMILLAKAFKMFGEVNWKEAKWGIGVLALFGGTMVLLGATMTATAPMLLAAGAMMGLFALSVIGLAKAMQMAEKPLTTIIPALGDALAKIVNQIGVATKSIFGAIGDFIVKVADPTLGKGLLSTGAGLLGLSAGLAAVAYTSVGAGISSLFGGGVEDTINRIGESAAKHASNIETLSFALERLARSITELREMEAITMDIEIDKKSVGMLDRISKDFVANTAKSNTEIIENHITIEIDGAKLARKIVKTSGVRG